MAVETVDTADDPRLAAYRALHTHDGGRRDGFFVAESDTVVRQLLESGRFTLDSVLLTASALDSLRAHLERRPEVPAYVAPIGVLRRIVGFDFHRGCLALGVRGPGPSADDLLAGAPRRLILLEDVSNPDNVGGVLRVARALGADAALLSDGCCDPLYRKAIRVSMGAALELPWTKVAAWEETLSRVRTAGFTLIALHPRGATDVAALGTEVPPPERAALLLGAEGAGLRASTVAAADLALRIPMAAVADSINLVTACAVALDRLGWARRGGAVAREPVRR